MDTGEGVSVGNLPARPVFHFELVRLEFQEPPRHPGVGVFVVGHPLQGSMVGDDRELMPQEVVA